MANGISNNNEDVSGINRIARNVVTSWLSYFVFIITGFIMPRMIDNHLGQTMLGIWDLSWTIVSYVGLSGLGIGSSVSRYVAKYRAANDYDQIGRIVSSSILLQFIIAAFIMLLISTIVYIIPSYLSEREGIDISETQKVILYLGLSLAIQQVFDTSRGVLTGYHRWDIFNGLNSLTYAITTALMIMMLFMDGRLVDLAIIYATMTFANGFVRTIYVYRHCTDVRPSYRQINKSSIVKSFMFGLKTLVATLPTIILIQTTNIMLAIKLGPAILAVFARPINLIRHIDTFITKFTYVLTPTAGSYVGSGDNEKLKRFFLEASKFNMSFALPFILILLVFGDAIIRFWMGQDYVDSRLMTILALGFILPISQGASVRVLMGMNMHGRISFITLGLSLVSFIVLLLYIGEDYDVYHAAMALAIPLIIANGIVMPVYTCKKLGIRLLEYLSYITIRPVLANAIYLLYLLMLDNWLELDTLMNFLIWNFVGFILLAYVYWVMLLPLVFKEKIAKKFTKKVVES